MESYPRYSSTDEMRSEFGSYRVNGKTKNLCDSSEAYPIEVLEDPVAEDRREAKA